ncbi:MAG: hydroxymethylbilane synthase [Woeseiaceae bacterium]|nr:hydroxymethylbilane synthase [Woeseiaceae bacterium]
MHIRIATRKSLLALWQAKHVAAEISRHVPGCRVELVPLSTRGDEVLDRSLQKIGGKGLFIKELEVAMQDGRADMAVHSMKDVPAVMPDGFCLAAILERGNPADALLATGDLTLAALPRGARIGSSSLRRQAQLLARRPDVTVWPLRGNVQTRIGKLEAGEFDAIVLAAAGLERLDLAHRISEALATDTMVPAAGQGTIGIECRGDRHELIELLGVLEHPATKTRTLAERAVAHRLEASCHSPVASYAVLNGDTLVLDALVARPDGGEVLRQTRSGPAADAEALGTALADELLAAGADRILRDAAA